MYVLIVDQGDSVTLATVDDLGVPMVIYATYQYELIEAIQCKARLLNKIYSHRVSI